MCNNRLTYTLYIMIHLCQWSSPLGLQATGFIHPMRSQSVGFSTHNKHQRFSEEKVIDQNDNGIRQNSQNQSFRVQHRQYLGNQLRVQVLRGLLSSIVVMAAVTAVVNDPKWLRRLAAATPGLSRRQRCPWQISWVLFLQLKNIKALDISM